ncbi:prohead core protein [uncultured Caudovirales phage]|uniref:Prohead core protein n=1 Tax=uncultured Caudovirales phage TaxID=2100421 RepID=A0A6J7WXD1_9CAUD|nr:prohead core protein [uncultured Caudovirales phage]
MSKEELNTEDLNPEVVSEEGTSNAGTIDAKPTISRSDLMRSMVSYATKLGPEELADFVSRIGSAEEMTATPDQIYASTQQVTGDASGKNKAGINSGSAPSEPMKKLAKEDLALVFGDSQDLSEEFKDKVSTIFEAAVATRVDLERVKIEEEVAAEAEEALEAIKEEIEENIDNYLNYAVAEWMSENKLAVESNIRTEVAESFLNGLKSLFEEHYVDIPEDKVDVVESLSARVEELEAMINETTEKNIELSKIVSEKQVKETADGLAEGLTDTQKEKFAKLIEAVDYNSVEEFTKKANIIKETYFASKGDIKVAQDQLLNEAVDEPESAPYVDPGMAVYVNSISRTVKK